VFFQYGAGADPTAIAFATGLQQRLNPLLFYFVGPLGALGALTRIEMQRLIERVWLAAGFTAVLVTHDVHEAVALADRIVVLDRGRISLTLPVLLPRPRVRHGSAFAALAARVLDRLLVVTPATTSHRTNEFDGIASAFRDNGEKSNV
jgi:sulfonate transport system ATP-binding protein